MFPDPTLRWLSYSSIMDGMCRPPSALAQGFWRGVLYLTVIEGPPGIRAYGVEIDCEAYFAVEEMMYSIANHGDKSGQYDGGVYIKQAETSRILETFNIDPFRRAMRHFSFVGADFCYETIGVGEPIVSQFDCLEASYAWGPDRQAKQLPQPTLKNVR